MKMPSPQFGEPVVAALSQPDENRWGFTQFPALAKLPDGRILLTYADARDASESHGDPAPALITEDEGAHWAPYTADLDLKRPHLSITEAYDGEYLTIPAIHYFNVRAAGISMPEPVASTDVYGKVHTYRAADLPAEVLHYFQYIQAQRWTPDTRTWEPVTVEYDTRDLLVWKRDNSDLLPRPFFERPATRHQGVLLYADYRVRYALEDGFVPPKGATALMASSDNGRSFQRRTIIAADRSGQDLYGEPALAETTDGGLICVIRKTDQVQKPMAITSSYDRGHTWESPREFCPFGVFPCLLKLKSGPLVLTYGRPGVTLRFSPDGNGREWSPPIPLISGDPHAVQKDSCGYTNMLSLGENRFLLTYSHFNHFDPQGVRRKAILTRQVSLS